MHPLPPVFHGTSEAVQQFGVSELFAGRQTTMIKFPGTKVLGSPTLLHDRMADSKTLGNQQKRETSHGTQGADEGVLAGPFATLVQASLSLSK